MALSSTIYKFSISLSDINRNYYDALNLTVAQHPSETVERMMVRVLAFCIHAEEFLEFTKGLSTPETPDIWSRSLDGVTQLWIEVGEPSYDKLKKASRLANEVWVYCFNSKSNSWWEQEQKKMSELNMSVRQFAWKEIESLAAMAERTMDMSVTISGDSAFVATGQGEVEVNWAILKQ